LRDKSGVDEASLAPEVEADAIVASARARRSDATDSSSPPTA
jgi:hypothetical protein